MRRRSSFLLLTSIALLASCSSASARAPEAQTPPEALAVQDPAKTLPSAPEREVDLTKEAQAKSLPGEAEVKPEPASAPPPVDPDLDGRPRMAATDYFAYIYKKPKKEGLALGYVRMGTSVPLKSDTPVTREGCKRGWYAVEPRGFICLEDRTTLDLSDPYYRALKEVGPDSNATWPYYYAFSNGAPMYSRLPTAEEQEKAEKKFGEPGTYVQLPLWSRGHEELLSTEPIAPTGPIPAIFDGKRSIYGGLRNPKTLVWRTATNGTLLAYAKAFEANGRTWLVTPDLMLVPADRVRKIKRSTFHGVNVAEGWDLPIAWNRTKGEKPKLHRDDTGKLTESADVIPAKTPVKIRPDKVTQGGEVFFELREEPGVFVRESDVTVTWQRTQLPNGVKPGQKWIEAKILPGTLTAYGGLTPVRATMFSPGKGGVPVPGMDHERYATTAIGFFPLEWKERIATMTNENGEPKILWYTDVPRIQYLKAPLAMHVAYWHEDFGNPKSAECVNISAMDGQWLFDWTEPFLPEGWGAIRPGGGNGPSTPVVVSAK